MSWTRLLGAVVLGALPPGKYTFTAKHAGFRKAVTNDVDLESAAISPLTRASRLAT